MRRTKMNIFRKSSYIILLLGIFLSIFLSWNTYQNQIEGEKLRFNLETKQIRLLIKTRMDAYKQVLLGGVGLFNSSNTVTRDMWKQYVRTQKIEKTFPGIQGFGYSQVVKAKDKKTHESTLKAEGFLDYHIKPKGKRALYTSIIYLEPFDVRNKRAFGYDMYSNSIRKEAMDNAIESKEAAMSGKVRLLQENSIDEQAGFLLYLPIYKKGSSLDTKEERFEAIQGFVYSAFRIKDLMQGVTGDKFNNINFRIFDGKTINNDNLMFDSSLQHKNNNARLSSQRELIFAGRIWNMEFSERSAYGDEYNYNKHWFILLLGILLSFVIFGIMVLIERDSKKKYQNSKNLEALAVRMKLALKAGKIGIWEWNYSNNSVVWDDRMYEMYGITPDNIQEPFIMWSSALDEMDKSTAKKELDIAVETHNEYNQKFWIKTPSGTKRYIHSIGVSEYDAHNKPIRMIGVTTDVTEQKIHEEQLNSLVFKETSKRLEQEKLMLQQAKLAAMGEMIGAIAHQWRQPLGAIGGSLINIEESYEYNELSKEYLEKQINSAEKNLSFMSKTIDDFRNFFAPAKNKINFCIQKATMNSISIVNAQMYDNNIKIKLLINIDNQIKEIKDFNNTNEIEHSLMVNGYPNEFTQVLVNLFANAKDALFASIKNNKINKDEALILISILNKDANVIINVKDNAGGLPSDIIDRVFEPYFTTKEQGKGTGIGLYMSKTIIEDNMGGNITVSNDKDGAIFSIQLKKVKND